MAAEEKKEQGASNKPKGEGKPIRFGYQPKPPEVVPPAPKQIAEGYQPKPKPGSIPEKSPKPPKGGSSGKPPADKKGNTKN